jgi:hypothetical protein
MVAVATLVLDYSWRIAGYELKTIFLALVILLQVRSSFAAGSTTPIPTKPFTPKTMFLPLQKSMQDLIGNGYQVVNVAVGLTSFGYLLKQERRYVTCAVQPDSEHKGAFVSECRAMN